MKCKQCTGGKDFLRDFLFSQEKEKHFYRFITVEVETLLSHWSMGRPVEMIMSKEKKFTFTDDDTTEHYHH